MRPPIKSRARDRGGYVLIFVLCVSVIILGIIAAVLVYTQGSFGDHRVTLDRQIAQYLCETGASVAILDMNAGHIGTKSGQWMSRTFTFTVGSSNYASNYQAYNETGVWAIVSWVQSPLGLNTIYHTTIMGRMAFPIFVKGFGGI